MLQIEFLESSSQRRLYLDEFLQARTDKKTWVVPDLKNKFDIQKLFLKKNGYFEDHHVLRASDLWTLLLRRARPEWQIISKDFLQTWLKEQLKKEDLKWGQQVDRFVLDQMQFMQPLFNHQHGPQMIRSWFQESPDSLQRWGGWYLLAEKYHQELVKKKRTLREWVSHLLVSENSFEAIWDRELVIDLGNQITTTEVEILITLSQKTKVTVLVPSKDFSKKHPLQTKPYQDLLSKFVGSGQNQNRASSQRDPGQFAGKRAEVGVAQGPLKGAGTSSAKFFKFSGVLAEVKMAVAQIRHWIDEGVATAEIAVLAPDLEQYWPMLLPHLQAEGIAFHKEVSIKVQTLTEVGQWLSQIRVASGDVKYSDLESACYNKTDCPLSFEEFFAQYSELLDAEDLARNQIIFQGFKTSYRQHQVLEFNEFFGYLVAQWGGRQNLVTLEIILREMMAGTDVLEAMELSSWISWLEQVVAHKEIKVQPAQVGGIHLANLRAGDLVLTKKRILLGLTDVMMAAKQHSTLSATEIRSLASQTGFNFEDPELSPLELELAWLARDQEIEAIYSYPMTGFAGGAEAPCEFWLQGLLAQASKGIGEKKDELKVFDFHLVWDQDQRQKDLTDDSQCTFSLAGAQSLSPSSVEEYLACPFKVTASRFFGLRDFPVLDLDVDRRTIGSLAHAILSALVRPPRKWDWSERELKELIEGMRQQLRLENLDDFIWQGLRDRHFAMANKFLTFEREWNRLYPGSEILGSEIPFSLSWQASNLKSEWMLKGKIDRLDGDKDGQLLVLDYKTSANNCSSFGSWLKNHELQLALYMLALQQGAIEEYSAREVVGAFYYILKSMDRKKGLSLDQDLLHFVGPATKTGVEKKTQTELLQAVESIVTQMIQRFEAGDFSPRPEDEKECRQCQWRNLCRAPHMN